MDATAIKTQENKENAGFIQGCTRYWSQPLKCLEKSKGEKNDNFIQKAKAKSQVMHLTLTQSGLCSIYITNEKDVFA